ncbi:pentatricopeptide repeat-containing protein At3g26630, chloroplastic-like [Macadamia integrifolia]|uniref:pentatricopeptide repeat-containing protein At3g26630, chloroplastic-like n=1 Tax=Macadamia integrifolia TaxID=60698 RepID=UPI001C4E92A3|nr:pentatricopeptide repeat-containing protein At3g26630, chloroplastic-like [Macadamia integrifolia]XP_042507241.1 pentatricopeptide repeat-containing protein At3g26630, chloroplastic-like [Macadamia integrifolia]XP_042507242.1 pentatricopeptide repeat-containing protein At3g26630, chloroplastic-like [Macadamia integrifolia]
MYIGNDSSFLRTSDAFQVNPFPSSRRRLDSWDALSLLQNCRGFEQLKQIHGQIIRNGLSQNQILASKLLRLCSSYNRMDYAIPIFYQIQNPNTFTWNIMIRANTLNGKCHDALLLYNLMMRQGVPPDKFTFPFVIKACLVSSRIDRGKEVHALAIKTGFSEDIFLQNNLMDLYFKCGDSNYARKLFNKMHVRSVVTWTTMVSGLASAGELEAARTTFELMPVRNVVSWTAMINAYARNQQPHEAFERFRRMQLDNVKPNEYTLVSLLIACTELGSLSLGSWLHDFVLKNGFELGVFLGTALVDMYSKCGSLDDAKKVFNKMQHKSIATWNSMITSLGVHGKGEEALSVFAEMEKTNLRPDAITFVGVLCACVQTGLVDEGCRYFKCMTERYHILPTIDHYSCMFELLNRAGMLNEAYELRDILPVEPDADRWEDLLEENRVNGNAALEEVIYKHVRKLNHMRMGQPCEPSGLQPQYIKWEVG